MSTDPSTSPNDDRGESRSNESFSSLPAEGLPSDPSARSIVADSDVEAELRRRTRRSFLVGGAAALAGIFGWRWLTHADAIDAAPAPFRRMLEFNERVARSLYSNGRLAPTFSKEDVMAVPRVNGRLGLSAGFDPSTWSLRVTGLAGGDRMMTIDRIKALPRMEMITEFKCIEGWSMIVQWGGARLIDFIASVAPRTRSGAPADPYKRPEDLLEYISMITPDRGYYVGLDIESALHPQTLLAYELNGKPLTLDHGAPLRLVTPVKYGVKNIKRIGTIAFTDERPEDYWAKQGYDWYAGL